MKIIEQLNKIIHHSVAEDCLYIKSNLTFIPEYMIIPIDIDGVDFNIIKFNPAREELILDGVVTVKLKSLSTRNYTKVFALFEESKITSIVNLCLGN